MTAESSSNNLSPHSPVLSGDDGGNNNPRLQRTAWAQVVRGEHEMSAVLSSSSSPPLPPSVATAEEAVFLDSSTSKETQLENSDGNNSNVGHSKKPAWNKPLNGVVGVGPVMGDVVSWPALSESTRPPPKSTSDSSKPSSDASVSTTQAPVISHSPQNQRHANTNPNPNFTPNNPLPVRQRSSKRGGGAGGGSVQSGFSHPPPPPPLPPPFPLFEMPHGALVAGPGVPDSPFREPPYMGNSWEGRSIGGFLSQSHSVADHSSQRNSSRRGNFGGSLRGNRLHHNSHKSRRDQDRDWNASRSSNARDVHVPQQIAPPRGFIRPPPPPGSPFMTHHSIRPFGNPMGFDMTSPFLYVPTLPPESFMGVPFIAHAPPPPPMFFPVMDATFPTSLVNQIDYYFSDANLVKDNFLRSKMDAEGWVPVRLIARFPRVQQLTENIQLILDSLRASSVVEVQGNKIRRRNDWTKWIPTSVRLPTDSGSLPPIESTYNTMTTSLRKVALDDSNAYQSIIMDKADSSMEVVPCRGSSDELTSHSKVANGENIKEEACSSQR